jgi:hypothetical protein
MPWQGRRLAMLASIGRAMSWPISSPRRESVGIVAEELGTEIKRMNARIVAFDDNEILRGQEHTAFS